MSYLVPWATKISHIVTLLRHAAMSLSPRKRCLQCLGICAEFVPTDPSVRSVFPSMLLSIHCYQDLRPESACYCGHTYSVHTRPSELPPKGGCLQTLCTSFRPVRFIPFFSQCISIDRSCRQVTRSTLIQHACVGRFGSLMKRMLPFKLRQHPLI